MKYQLYVGENCHDCQKVKQAVQDKGYPLEIKNMDKGDKPPMDLFILPALLSNNGELKAYGIDIVDFLMHQEKNEQGKSWWQKLFG